VGGEEVDLLMHHKLRSFLPPIGTGTLPGVALALSFLWWLQPARLYLLKSCPGTFFLIHYHCGWG
jgi:hypothetical protein